MRRTRGKVTAPPPGGSRRTGQYSKPTAAKRGNGAPVLAILLSDMHLREDRPICRTDDYWIAMERKLAFLRELQEQYDVPVVHGGDLFEHWKPSPYLLSFAIENLPRPFFTVCGNHDMPQHNMEQIGRSGMRTLEAAGAVEILPGVHWGQEPAPEHTMHFPHPEAPGGARYLLVWHVMTYEGKVPYPGCTEPPARKLLRRYGTDVDMILVGHNHVPFLVEDKAGRKMLNPGSMLRVKADQQDHEPSVYLWRVDNTLERVVLPHEPGVVTREHIEAKAADDPRRYQAFIEQLRQDAPELSFRGNMERFLSASNTSKRIKQLILESLE